MPEIPFEIFSDARLGRHQTVANRIHLNLYYAKFVCGLSRALTRSKWPKT
jgi:hypothetical protein